MNKLFEAVDGLNTFTLNESDSYAEDKLMSLVKIMNSDIKPGEIKLSTTDDGNLYVSRNGHHLLTINGDQFTEAQLDELRDQGYFESPELDEADNTAYFIDLGSNLADEGDSVVLVSKHPDPDEAKGAFNYYLTEIKKDPEAFLEKYGIVPDPDDEYGITLWSGDADEVNALESLDTNSAIYDTADTIEARNFTLDDTSFSL